MEMLTSNSTYFSTSEPKAKLMTRYSREMTLINSDSSDLTKKKVSSGNNVFEINHLIKMILNQIRGLS